MTIDDNLEIFNDFNELNKLFNIRFNYVKQHIIFYDQHKRKHGSFSALPEPLYGIQMQKRYDFIYCKINEIYEKKLKKWGLGKNGMG